LASLPREPSGFFDRYILVEIIGSGAYGKVYRALELSCPELPCAIKCITPRQDGQEVPYMEIELTFRAQCPFVPKLYDAHYTPFFAALVFEVLDEDLSTAIRKAGGKLPERKVLSIATCLSRALSFVHSKRIMHRDLHCKNVLLAVSNEETHAKLADFGQAIRFQEGQLPWNMPSLTAAAGALMAVPPEVIFRHGVQWARHRIESVDRYVSCAVGGPTSCVYDFKADVWALGVLICTALWGYCYEIDVDVRLLPSEMARVFGCVPRAVGIVARWSLPAEYSTDRSPWVS